MLMQSDNARKTTEIQKYKSIIVSQIQQIKAIESMEKTSRGEIEKYKTQLDSVTQEKIKAEEALKREKTNRGSEIAVNLNSGMKVRLTAYTLDVADCGKSPGDHGYGITATGFNLAGLTRSQAMTVAVDPTVFPLGSKIYIKIEGRFSYFSGTYTARDTGGAVHNNTIDVYMVDRSLALQFGVQYATAYIQ